MRSLDRSALAKKHAGKWIAFRSDRKTVIACGSSVAQVLKAANKKGVDHPVVTRMPKRIVSFIG